MKVATIKLLHDFQGLHLKKRHFEHKCYNKHSFQKIKSFGRNLSHLSLTWCFQQLENLCSTHFLEFQSWNFQQLEELSSTHFFKISKLKSSTTRRTLFQTLSPWNLILSKFWKQVFHTWKTYNTLKKLLSHLPLACKWIPTLFATLQTKNLPPKGFSLSMLYKLNPWLLLVLTKCPFSCLVWAHNLLETTWKQARNETLKIHEMKQLC